MTSVILSTRRLSPGESLVRRVTGTIAASSARYGISMAITSAPSFIGRLLKMSWTRPGHGSYGLGRCRRRKVRAEHDAEEAGDAEQAETKSGHGRGPSLDGGNASI